MGAMGRYIAALTNEERDRLISATDYVPFIVSDGRGGGCLLGHAEGLAAARRCFGTESYIRIDGLPDSYNMRWNAAKRFNAAAVKWPARTVRAIKLRAARLNGCSPEQIEAMLRETVPA